MGEGRGACCNQGAASPGSPRSTGVNENYYVGSELFHFILVNIQLCQGEEAANRLGQGGELIPTEVETCQRNQITQLLRKGSQAISVQGQTIQALKLAEIRGDDSQLVISKVQFA